MGIIPLNFIFEQVSILECGLALKGTHEIEHCRNIFRFAANSHLAA